MPKFSHLHVHTQYSLLDGAASIEGLYDKAIKDEMPALAITDHGNMFGAFKFVSQAWKKTKVVGKDAKGTIKQVAALGYGEVENFGYNGKYFGMSAAEYKTFLSDVSDTGRSLQGFSPKSPYSAIFFL